MKAQQRRSYMFDSRSVMLFAALTLGGAGAIQAQAQSPSPTTASPQFGPGGEGNSSAPRGSGYTIGPSEAQQPAQAAAAAFDRADSNRDGQLSAREASQLPAVSQRFRELDTNQDGMLSRSEFEKGVNS